MKYLRYILAMMLLVAGYPLKAQHAVSTDSALSRNIQKDVDSVSLNPRLNLRSKRALLRIDARADTIRYNKAEVDTVVKHDTTVVVKTDTVVKHDTTIVTRVDTVYVVKPPVPPDTTTPPDTVKPPIPPITAWTHPYAPLPNGIAYAEFPRDSVAVPQIPMTRTITVQSLQAALDTAQTGDRLVIPTNSTTNNLAVKATPRVSWVTVQGTDSTSVIQGTIGGAVAAVTFSNSAHHVRFLGPLTIRAQTDATNAIVAGYGQTTVAQLPHHIILDGVTVTSANFQVRRCVWIDGQYIAVIRSKLLNCSNKSGDAQGILNSQGGPYRYQGNYIEGSHQCFMAGGVNPTITGDATSDVYFADNYCYKPIYWMGVSPYPGNQRQTKTALETKSIRRMLAERNVFRNVWPDAQVGFAALLKSENQGGDPTAQSKDITLRYNLFDSTASGINIAAHPSSLPAINAARFSIYDNVFTHLSKAGDNGICVQILDATSDMVLMHNTCTDATLKAVSFDGAGGIRTDFDANWLANGQYGVHGSGAGVGAGSIKKWVTDGGGIWRNNAIIVSDCSQYPAGTTCKLPVPPGIGADSTKIPH